MLKVYDIIILKHNLVGDDLGLIPKILPKGTLGEIVSISTLEGRTLYLCLMADGNHHPIDSADLELYVPPPKVSIRERIIRLFFG